VGIEGAEGVLEMLFWRARNEDSERETMSSHDAGKCRYQFYLGIEAFVEAVDDGRMWPRGTA